jgi:VCBS repeat-containing protein
VNGSAASVGRLIRGAHGTLTLNANGSYSYVAAKGKNEEDDDHASTPVHDSFSYTANDGHGGTAAATLTITVTNPGETNFKGTDGNEATDGSHSASIALLVNYLASTLVASSASHDGMSVADRSAGTGNQDTFLAVPQRA